MTRAGIDYIRGIYQTALLRRREAELIANEYSRGHMSGYHASTIDLCESIAQFERFSLVEAEAGKEERA